MSFENRASDAKANADRYIQMLLDTLAGRDPLVTMPELPRAIEALVAGLDDAALRRPEKPGKWSVIQVVQHLADSEIVWGYRARKVLAAPGATIAGYDQDAWSATLRYDAANLEIALAQLRAMRAANLALLGSLTDEEWERAGMHSERGPESVRQMSRLIGGHDFVHRNQIARIKLAIGA
jgi:hypothetical protein